VRTLVSEIALLVTVGGFVVVVLGTLLTGEGRGPLRAALDLWVAAGMLRLTVATDLPALTTAAALLAIRQLVGLGLRSRATDRS
jgi:hypothetical protein